MDFSRGYLGDGLFPPENEALYSKIKEIRPDVVFEVGTRRGGGSTYFIASALYENGKGALYTIECDKECYDGAVGLYETVLSYLKPFVKLHYGISTQVYPAILDTIEKIDVLFLDGAENSQQTVDEYNLLEPKLSENAYLICHDWHIHKMDMLRPIIMSSKSWENLLTFTHTQTGFSINRKIIR